MQDILTPSGWPASFPTAAAPQHTAGARGCSQPPAPKIFLKRLQLHEHYGCPLSFFSLQNIQYLPFSWKPRSPLMCDFPPDTSWTLFACTMFHLHHHPRARWAYSFPALTHLATAGCSYLSAVHHQFFFHQGVSRPMLWMKQLTTISFNKFSNFLTLKAPRTGRGIKLYSLYLNCSVAVLLYSALSLLTGCVFFNTIQTFHIKLWKKQLFGLFCLCLSELNIISLLFFVCFFFYMTKQRGFCGFLARKDNFEQKGEANFWPFNSF